MNNVSLFRKAITSRLRSRTVISAADLNGVATEVRGLDRTNAIRAAFAALVRTGRIRASDESIYSPASRGYVRAYEVVAE